MQKPILKDRKGEFRRPSVRDVARLAGVSVSTVSRALSHPEMVREDKLMAVREAVAKLNYVIQGVGRALVSRRTHMVGAILPSVDHAMFAKTAFALQNTLAEQGYMLALACSDFDAGAEPALARRFVERGVDGIVLFGRRHEPELLTLLEGLGIPYVSTWAYDPGTSRTSIGFDNRKAAMLVVEHLVALGHRDIGIVSGFERSEWQRERLHWLKNELERHGLCVNPNRIVSGPISYETGRMGLRTLVQGQKWPSAIICGHDIIAVGAIAMCQEIGIAIPDKLSLTGFEDLELASNVTPPLTTVHFPAEELGVRAGEEILRRISNEQTQGQIELPIKLMARGTTSLAQKAYVSPRRRIPASRAGAKIS
jgi:LacI family transcriptional regulator